MEEHGRVKFNNKCVVRPTRKSPTKFCDLITFDLPYVTFHYNQKVMVFRSPKEGLQSATEGLKSSLAEALSYFYPLAGRLCTNEEGILKVDCNGEGAEFIEASIEELTLEDVCKSDCETRVLRKLVPYNHIVNLYGSIVPLLAVQVTKIKDGIVLGISLNHVIVDGYSTWHFMKSWSHLCKGNKSIPVPPLHNRSAIRNTTLNLGLTLPTSLDPKPDTEEPSLKTTIFHFTKQAMDRLKSQANMSKPEGSKPYSYFQSLGSHIWQGVTRARKLKDQDITVFTLFIDCKSRMKPVVEEGYFGNVIQGIYGATAGGILLAGGLSKGAEILQGVIDGHVAEAIEEKNKAWESNPKLYDFSDAGLNCVTVGSSPRFDVYGVDFGWEKPLIVRSGPNNKFDGMVYLYPGVEGDGSVDVEISLHPSSMLNLESDELFLCPA